MIIKSIKIADKQRFKDSIEISFDKNKKIRSEQLNWLVKDDNLKLIAILGKNASGKSSIIRAIKSYFMLYDTAMSFEAIAGFSYNDPSRLLARTLYVSTQTTVDDKNQNIMNYYYSEPRYTITYEHEGNVIEHIIQVSVKKDNSSFYIVDSPLGGSPANVFKSKFELKERLLVNDSEVTGIFEDSSEKRIMWKMLKTEIGRSIQEDKKVNSELNLSMRSYLIKFIRNTAKWNNDFRENWTKEITKSFKKLALTNGWDDFKEFAYPVIKSADPIFERFDVSEDNVFVVLNVDGIKINRNISELSTGTRHIIWIMIRFYFLRDTGLFIHDEFDAFINMQLADFTIRKIFTDNDITGVITSHHPEIFDYGYRFDAIYETYNNGGSITIGSFDELYKIRNDKKLSNHFHAHWTTSPEDFY